MENLADQIQVSEVSVGILQFLNASGLGLSQALWSVLTFKNRSEFPDRADVIKIQAR